MVIANPIDFPDSVRKMKNRMRTWQKICYMTKKVIRILSPAQIHRAPAVPAPIMICCAASTRTVTIDFVNSSYHLNSVTSVSHFIFGLGAWKLRLSTFSATYCGLAALFAPYWVNSHSIGLPRFASDKFHLPQSPWLFADVQYTFIQLVMNNRPSALCCGSLSQNLRKPRNFLTELAAGRIILAD